MQNILWAIVLILGIFTNSSASQASDAKINLKKLDYSKEHTWLVKDKTLDKEVDVFYVYPTIYTAKNPKNMDITNPKLKKHAKALTITQAGVFSPFTNMFAPLYRQQSAAIQSMQAGNNNADALEDPIFKAAAKDIEDAFAYYLQHLNKNRPFILAGHSQGTMALIHLMRRSFNEPSLQKRLVAAYLIGYSITDEDLKTYPWMKLAQGETDTGVIISFNTQGIDAGPSPVLLKNAHAINPLNWKTDSTPAINKQNLGAKFFDGSNAKLIEEVSNFAGAYVDTKKGVLIATNIKTPKSSKIDLVNIGRWPKEVYHKFDYSFWFNNLQDNVEKRISAYKKRNN